MTLSDRIEALKVWLVRKTYCWLLFGAGLCRQWLEKRKKVDFIGRAD